MSDNCGSQICLNCGRTFADENKLNRHLGHSAKCRVVWDAERIRLQKNNSRTGRTRRTLSSLSNNATEFETHDDFPFANDNPINYGDLTPACLIDDGPPAAQDNEVHLGEHEFADEFAGIGNRGDIFVVMGPEPIPLGETKTAFERLRDKSEQESQNTGNRTHYAPLKSKDEWDIIKFMHKAKLTTDQTRDFFNMKFVRERASFHSKYGYNKKVDALPKVSKWTCVELEYTVEMVDGTTRTSKTEFWKRHLLEVIQELAQNPDFKDAFCNTTYEMYTDGTKKIRIYSQAWTGHLCAEIRKKLPPGTVLFPLVLASDETQLTQMGGDKKGWPVYLGVMNIDSEVRRQPSRNAMKLVAYLPYPNFEGLSDAERSARRAQMFHDCMADLVRPLVKAGEEGVVMQLNDGKLYQCHPILAAYVADHPEQCLVGCTKQNRCSICLVERTDRGENYPMNELILRDPERELAALEDERLVPGSSYVFDDDGLKPTYPPFWADLPHTNIYLSFTPDLLHQLHKGTFKSHVFEWDMHIAGAEIDKRMQCLPNHPLLRMWTKGVSEISQWTGREAKAVERVFVGVIADLLPPQVVRATRAMIDIIYFASYSVHTTESLRDLQKAIDEFHAAKDIFIELGIREHFNIPKLHMLQHYVLLIMLFGSAQGYNTEASERLHIDLAKNLYRQSNRKDYIKQMTASLERTEKINNFSSYVAWLAENQNDVAVSDNGDKQIVDDESESDDEFAENDSVHSAEQVHVERRKQFGSSVKVSARVLLPKKPSWMHVTQATLQTKFGAINILPCLKNYIIKKHPYGRVRPTCNDRLHVYKRLAIVQRPLSGFGSAERKDVVRARPKEKVKDKNCFDTVLIRDEEAEADGAEGIKRYRVAQVRAIFILPEYFPYREALAYVELFTRFTTQRQNCDLYSVKRSMKSGGRQRESAVIPVSSIRSSCHLIPSFGATLNSSWNAENVLEKCSTFYINTYLDLDTFQMFIG